MMEKVFDLDVRIADIETAKGGFLYVDKNPKTGEYHIFRIDKYVNDLYAFVKYLKEEEFDYLVTFNGLAFDAQVIQWILERYPLWGDLTGAEIAVRIWQFAQDVIDDTRHELLPPYREEELWVKQIDLFKIHHYDNKARRCSLKWVEFSVNMENIEDMPHPHWLADYTEEMLVEMVWYCRNDVDATEILYWITRGITELEEYAGKDKIQDRLDLIDELKFPLRAMNFSDVKIGDELNKRSYCKLAKIDQRKLYELKQNRKSTAGFTFGDCIPDYVSFKTEEFRAFHNYMKDVRVNLMEKEKFPFTYNGTTYVIAKGGIHSTEKKRSIVTEDDEDLEDADIGSQYPRAINKRGIFPSHLGPLWNKGYGNNTDIRISFKEKGANEQDPNWRKWKGISDMYKLALNGGGFGKLNEKKNWQYDTFAMHKCTIGNEFEIMMLIEDLALAGIKTVSANTDGIVCLFKKSLRDVYFNVCHEWEKKVGNDVTGKLEFTSYRKLFQTSVNDYIAIKANGKVKKKGDFLTSFELHKDKSARVVPLALEAYFKDGISIEETIRNHGVIWDFCIGVKGNEDYYYKSINLKDGHENLIHSKVVRYFVSNNGVKLLKVKKPGSEKDGPDVSVCESGDWLVTLYNRAFEKEVSKLDINYNYYIEKARDIVDGIENPIVKRKKIYNNPNQISLF